MSASGNHTKTRARPAAIVLSILAALGGCASDGDDGLPGVAGTTGPEGPPQPTQTVLDRHEDLPGLVVEVTGLSGASGADGTFQVGDKVAVTFTVKKGDGTSLPIEEVDSTSILIGGPTSNYQRVLPQGRTTFSLSDVKTAAVKNADGSYTYTFSSGLPSAYGPPLYDTTKFTAGELTGASLLAGTYTVGIRFYKSYYVDGVRYRDVGHAFKNFLFGGATTIEAREVVTTANCNQCHVTLQMHGGAYRDTRMCVLCHTSGAENRSSTDSGDATDVTIDFRVMIHKIHNGKHLPSVLGVGTNSNGTRNYAVTPTAYAFSGYDFSEIGFPVWPNLNVAMPRDQGYGSLTTTQKGLEDEIRRGVTDCNKCHGDPDGSGPLAAPAQGDLIYAQPSRRACGACHDDVDFTKKYVANQRTMDPQTTDAACVLCHTTSGTEISIKDAHLHPLKNPALNAGLNVTVTSATPSSGGTLDPGGTLSVTFSIKDDAGTDVQPSGLGLTVVVSGPNNNRNLLLYGSIPTAALGATATSYILNVPERVALEFLGVATGVTQTVKTARAPHWNVIGDLTSVQEATFTGTTNPVLVAAAPALQNYVDVASASGFARDDYIVIERDASKEEYLRIRRVEGNRLWFSTRYDTTNSPPTASTLGGFQPYLRFAHDQSALVERVTVTTKTLTTQWSLSNATTGEITLVDGQFTPGRGVIASYTTDFVMPFVFSPPLNDSPDLGETWGEWTGKAIVDGTYAVGIWGSYQWAYNPFEDPSVFPVRTPPANYPHDNTYRTTSLPSNKDFLVGSATTLASYSLIDLSKQGGRCNDCHNTLLFHGGGRRDVETCLLCHGTAGSEDWPNYRYSSSGSLAADPTPGVTINFRTMLHKIHKGKDLANATSYVVNGFNGGGTSFEEIGFPPMPGGVKHCDKCHGTSAAWKEPASRDHPTEQGAPVRVYRATCGACHDSDPAQAHIELQTYNGVESCKVCHGPGSQFEVEVMHKNR